MFAWMSSNGKRVLALLSKALNIDVAYFVKGGFWLGAGYVSIAIMRLLLVILLANLVSRDFYGQYQFVFAVIATIMVFSLPGMDTAICQSVANGFNHSLVDGTKSKLRWSLLGSVVAVGLASFFKFIHYQPFWSVFIAIAVLSPFYSSFTSVIAYYRGKEDFRRATIYNVLIVAVGTVPIIIIAFFVESLLAMVVSSLGFAVLLYLVLYFVSIRNISGEVDSGVVAYGRNLTFMTFLTYVAPYVDRLIVAGVAGFEGLAVYSIAMAITLNLSVNGQIISILLLPKFSRESPHHVHRIKKLFWWVCLLVVLAVIVVIFAIPWVVSFLFAEKYVESIPYAQIGALYLAFFIPATILRTFFQGRKRTKLLYVYNLSIGIINLVLLGILAPLFGIMGAVISKVLLGLVGFVFLVVSFYFTTNIKNQH